jgi:hypothetical protein
MERNSIIPLFLLCRRRKRRRNRLNWVHTIIKERDEVCAFFTLFDDIIHQDEANKFLNYLLMSVSSFYELHRRLMESFHRRNSKMKSCIQTVEMLAVAIR